ncbi:uncharacterized protein PRCAT00003541001 [Priceomyces carsonii]|uniref:uncharacterized protein n=1 Tax=Priceomyces carsonii TaxID=28549 RepID=UPI002ED8A92D|nr:unnamed protein product [Priceomyces carsonii]
MILSLKYLTLGLYLSLCRAIIIDSQKSGNFLVLFQIFYDDEGEYFMAGEDMSFSVKDCQNDDVCPKISPVGNVGDFFLKVNSYDFFKSALEMNKNSFSENLNQTGGFFHSWQFDDKGNRLHSFHFDHKYKLIIVVPCYLFSIILCTFLYYAKRETLVKMNFKMNNISKLLLKYATLKIIVSLLYLMLLVLFDDHGINIFGSKSLLLVFCFLNYVLLLLGYALVILFVAGYYTIFFTFTNCKKVLINVTVLVLLQGIFLLPMLINQCNMIMHTNIPYFGENMIFRVLYIIWRIVMAINILCLAYYTYIGKSNKDRKFLISCCIIGGGYLLNPFIIVPEGGGQLLYFLKKSFILSELLFDNDWTDGIHIPEVIELLIIASLMYIWRDKYVEDDELEYKESSLYET